MDESEADDAMGEVVDNEEAVEDISENHDSEDAMIEPDTIVSPTKQTHHDSSSKKKTVKKALTSFIFYMSENRERVMKEHPELKFGEVGKLVGENFKLLTPEERAHYDNLAKLDKERYIRECEAFKAHSALHPEEYVVSKKIPDSTLTIPLVST